MITSERLKELLMYDPESGLFVRNLNRSKFKKGDVAGSSRLKHSGKRYVYIKIEGRAYMAHRLAFLYMTGKIPADQVDHINGDGEDNRWCNIRQSSQVENSKNARLRRDNTSGIAGVRWTKERMKWRVLVSNDVIGFYQDLFEACCVRKSLENKLKYSPGHGSVRPL